MVPVKAGPESVTLAEIELSSTAVLSTMVIVGDGDVVRPEHAVEMFRLLPHGELAILPGATHGLIVEKADLLAAMVLPFLDAESPP